WQGDFATEPDVSRVPNRADDRAGCPVRAETAWSLIPGLGIEARQVPAVGRFFEDVVPGLFLDLRRRDDGVNRGRQYVGKRLYNILNGGVIQLSLAEGEVRLHVLLVTFADIVYHHRDLGVIDQGILLRRGADAETHVFERFPRGQVAESLIQA